LLLLGDLGEAAAALLAGPWRGEMTAALGASLERSSLRLPSHLLTGLDAELKVSNDNYNYSMPFASVALSLDLPLFFTSLLVIFDLCFILGLLSTFFDASWISMKGSSTAASPLAQVPTHTEWCSIFALPFSFRRTLRFLAESFKALIYFVF